MAEKLDDIWMWMSSGGTSSSNHFDTGDNVIVQIDGHKTALLWDPKHSRELYADYHDMYGIRCKLTAF
jgi:ribosomal protein L16 Arg81 hydroxylase